jgi:hypothetical protein
MIITVTACDATKNRISCSFGSEGSNGICGIKGDYW